MQENLSRLIQKANLNEIELIELFTGLSEFARSKGLIALEPLAEKSSIPMVRAAINAMINGDSPQNVAMMTDNFAFQERQKLERKMRIIAQGLELLQIGDNPSIVEKTLNATIGRSPKFKPSGGKKRRWEVDRSRNRCTRKFGK